MSCAPHPTRGRIQLGDAGTLSGHTEGAGSRPSEGQGAAPAPPSLLSGRGGGCHRRQLCGRSALSRWPRGAAMGQTLPGLWHPGGAGWRWLQLFLSRSFPGPAADSRAAARRASRSGGFFATSSARARCGCCCVKSGALKMRKRGAGAGAGQGGEERGGAARGQPRRPETPPCPLPPPAQVTRVPLPACPRVALLGAPRGVAFGVMAGTAGCLCCLLAPGARLKRSRGVGAGGAGCPRSKSQRGLSTAAAACPGRAGGCPAPGGLLRPQNGRGCFARAGLGCTGVSSRAAPASPPPPPTPCVSKTKTRKEGSAGARCSYQEAELFSLLPSPFPFLSPRACQ